jgi:hypothetical protein
MAVPDVVEDENLCRFERRRLQKGQIAPLPGDEIQRPVKAFDKFGCNRNDFDRIHC